MDINHENSYWLGDLKNKLRVSKSEYESLLNKQTNILSRISDGSISSEEYSLLAAVEGELIQYRAYLVAYTDAYNICNKIVNNESK